MVGVIEAADTAAKAADIQLLGVEQIGGGLVSVRFCGDVAAVKTAVQAASRAVEQVAELVSAHVIARPGPGMSDLMEKGPSPSPGQVAEPVAQQVPPSQSVSSQALSSQAAAPQDGADAARGSGAQDVGGTAAAEPEPDLASLDDDDLAAMPVTRLRQLARRTSGLELQGRQISRANKQQLLEALGRARGGGSPV